MDQSNKLRILWTSDNVITSEKMVLMYAMNCMTHYWWSEVDILIWGASAKLVAENELIREKIKMAIHTGVKFSACKGCTDQLGISDALSELGIDVKYTGGELTEILKEGEHLLTI